MYQDWFRVVLAVLLSTIFGMVATSAFNQGSYTIAVFIAMVSIGFMFVAVYEAGKPQPPLGGSPS